MSGKNIKAFLDANTIISGLLFEGNEATLLELGRIKAINLETNNYVIEEASRVLQRPELQLTQKETTDLLRYLNTCLTVTKNPSNETLTQNYELLNDKKDIPVALGALQPEITYLVTGDKELLEKIPKAITTRQLLEQTL